jgi:hypothetical protein
MALCPVGTVVQREGPSARLPAGNLPAGAKGLPVRYAAGFLDLLPGATARIKISEAKATYGEVPLSRLETIARKSPSPGGLPAKALVFRHNHLDRSASLLKN